MSANTKSNKDSGPYYEETISSTNLCCNIHPPIFKNQDVSSSLQNSVIDLDKTKYSFNKGNIHSIISKKSPAKLQPSKIRPDTEYQCTRNSINAKEYELLKNRTQTLQKNLNDLSYYKQNLEKENRKYLQMFQELKSRTDKQKIIWNSTIENMKKDFDQLSFKFNCLAFENCNNLKNIEILRSQLDKITKMYDQKLQQVNLLSELLDVKNDDVNQNKQNLSKKMELAQKNLESDFKVKLIKKLKTIKINPNLALDQILMQFEKSIQDNLISKKKLQEKYQKQIQMIKGEEKILNAQLQSMKCDILQKDEQIKILKQTSAKQMKIFLNSKKNIKQQNNSTNKQITLEYSKDPEPSLRLNNSRSLLLDYKGKELPNEDGSKIKQDSLLLQSKVKQLVDLDECYKCKSMGKTIIALNQQLKQLKVRENQQYSLKINQLINSSFSITSSKLLLS